MEKKGFDKLAAKIAKDEELTNFVATKLNIVALLSLLVAISFVYMVVIDLGDYTGTALDVASVIVNIAMVGIFICNAIENEVKRKKILDEAKKKAEKKTEKKSEKK